MMNNRKRLGDRTYPLVRVRVRVTLESKADGGKVRRFKSVSTRTS